jgi:hypothetical protein
VALHTHLWLHHLRLLQMCVLLHVVVDCCEWLLVAMDYGRSL